ncbi:MAG: UDP-N-acetylmuramate--L-alanine ligase [Spirochaetota bacterium]
MFRNKNNMHFIGIGGVGMSGIAEILVGLGFSVSGSDLRPSDTTRRLESLGVTVFTGHSSSNIGDYNVVITSSAIDPSNPEIVEARRRKIPIIHRSEMLAELVRLKHGIGVAGTHGKTTTSSMLSSVLWSCGIKPTSVIGGKVLNFGSNARHGDGDYIVFEADESDGTFLKLLPTIAIVTNIDADHLDYYKYFEGLKGAFLSYINNVPFYGYAIICIDDPAVQSIEKRIERSYYTYGFSENADFRASNMRFENGMTHYDCFFRDEYLGILSLNLLGRHNVTNSLAVVAVARELEMPFEKIQKGLAEFQGVGRRLEIVGMEKGVTVIDDYGHHPTEVRATLAAVKTLGKRVITVFQPHRYTRTQLLWDEFGKSFPDADLLFLTEIYPAGEHPIEGVRVDLIAEAYSRCEGQDARIIRNFADIPDAVSDIAPEDDVILTLGAGDIYKAGKEILRRIAEK